MTVQQQFKRRLFFLGFIWLTVIAASAHAQSSSKKVRIGVSETHVGYLPLQVAYHKGFYKDEGIELEIILMPTNVINTTALTGQIDVKKVQLLIDLMRTNAKISRPVTVEQVADFSLVDKARKDLD